jgi:hypothetical protein
MRKSILPHGVNSALLNLSLTSKYSALNVSRCFKSILRRHHGVMTSGDAVRWFADWDSLYGQWGPLGYYFEKMAYFLRVLAWQSCALMVSEYFWPHWWRHQNRMAPPNAIRWFKFGFWNACMLVMETLFKLISWPVIHWMGPSSHDESQ